MNEETTTALNEIRSTYHENHMRLARVLMGSDLYHLDFLAIAALNRSLNLHAGFCLLIEARNITSAAPLLRLQLDNAFRFAAAWLVDNPHEFALKVMQGVAISKQKDRRGQPMTDRYLVTQLAKENPWITEVYKRTNGFVHLSETHIFSSMKPGDTEDTFHSTVSLGDAYFPDTTYLEACKAFQAATDVFFQYIEGWIITRDNPQLMAELRAKGEHLADL